MKGKIVAENVVDSVLMYNGTVEYIKDNEKKNYRKVVNINWKPYFIKY